MARKSSSAASSPASPDHRDAIIDAAMRLAATTPWRDLSLAEIAVAADISLADLRRAFASKMAILRGFVARVDATVLDNIDADLADEPARERLFDILVERFEHLQPHRAALESIQQSIACDPAALAEMNMVATQSMRWMLEAAGIGAHGLAGAARAQGLTLIMARTMRVFLRDDDPGLARTLAALDQHLSQGERFARRGDDLCRLVGGIRSVLKGRRRQPDYGAWEEAGGGI